MKRLGIVVLLVFGALAVFLAFAATAEAVPAPPPDYCGTNEVDVPDTGDAFDFTDACMHHDECYALGGGPLDRLRCDRAFLTEMLAWCTAEWDANDPRLLRCKLVAATYYTAVRLGGWLYFYNSNPV